MSLADLYASLRRDLARVAGSLSGKRPPPFSRRQVPLTVIEGGGAQRGIVPRTLRVREVVRETKDCVSLELEDPTGEPIAFTAGQFFTVIVTIDGEELRRAYSASSSALDSNMVRITVKRIDGGRVSTFLNETMQAGMSLKVLGPSGSFVVDKPARHIAFVAGGSGITPIMSILRTLLLTTDTKLSLVYGNRGQADIIFARALEELACDRLTVRHVLSDPPAGWTGGVGMLDEATVAREVPGADCYYVCGPEPMMAAVRKALADRGAPIHEEKFTSPHLRTGAPRVERDQVMTAMGKRVVVAAGQTMLEAGLGAGMNMPFSCAMGGCGACKVKLVSGEVEMEEPNCLTQEERAEGYVLACVGRPKTAVVVEAP